MNDSARPSGNLAQSIADAALLLEREGPAQREFVADWTRPKKPFDELECLCGHLYGRHPWTADNPRGYGTCLDCECRVRRERKVHEEAAARRAIAEDPTHVCGPFNEAFGCPGWVRFEVCAVCDKPKEATA